MKVVIKVVMKVLMKLVMKVVCGDKCCAEGGDKMECLF